MHPSRSKTPARRRPLFRIEAEALESRQLLTGGAGNTIALVAGTVATGGGTTPSAFILNASHFSAPKGRFTLGVDVVATTNSSLKPVITSIASEAKGHALVYRGPQGPKALVRASSDTVAHAVLTEVGFPSKAKNAGASYAVKITGASSTKGDFLLGYYLPGDADGNGKVDQADLTAIKSQNGKTVTDADYLFDADANRDGRVNRSDLLIARRNLGVMTTITPDITASLDPASDSGAADRITGLSTVKFTGVAAPGAKIAFAEVNAKTPGATTTVDASGKYSLTLKLAEGTNTYKVSSTDAFGQTISGSIQPVTYTTGEVPQVASIKAARS